MAKYLRGVYHAPQRTQPGRVSDVRGEAPFISFMSLGSIIGALIGSYLLRYAPGSILQVILGLILLVSAFKLSRKKKVVA